MDTYKVIPKVTTLAFFALLVLAGAPFVSHASEGEKPCCCCSTRVLTIVSGQTTTVVGDGFAVPVATSSAWTASIPDANWIWQAAATGPNATVAFEKSFTVLGTVLSATLDIAADNSYKVFIDGVPVAADAAATNFTLATQDTYDLTAVVTPGVHILRIEVTNNGIFSSLNPAGLLYKFRVTTCLSPPPEIDVNFDGITVIIRNRGTITNTTTAFSRTGGNIASGSVGGAAGDGGTVQSSAGNGNNGGAVAGNGGDGGTGGRGGRIVTGAALSSASTANELNTTRVRIER